MSVENPRYPHTCKIWRVTTDSPLVDEPVDYDPLADETEEENASQESSGTSATTTSVST